MRNVSPILLGFALMSLVFAGCAAQAPAPAKPAAPPAEAPKEAEKPAPPPEVAAVPQKPEEAAPTVQIVEAGKPVTVTFDMVHFDFDKYNIKPEFVPVIKKNADLLKGAAATKFVVEGHCDERGSEEYNLALGQHRATAVMNALVADGVEKDQLKTISYGKEKPIELGHDEKAWAMNRRAVIRPQ